MQTRLTRPSRSTCSRGQVLAVVSESELKPTKTGGGKYLQLTFQIIDGEFKGRLVWARLNSRTRAK